MFIHLLQKIRTIYNHPSYWRAIIACKYGEPLHYHHDGCPACDSIKDKMGFCGTLDEWVSA